MNRSHMFMLEKLQYKLLVNPKYVEDLENLKFFKTRKLEGAKKNQNNCGIFVTFVLVEEMGLFWYTLYYLLVSLTFRSFQA